METGEIIEAIRQLPIEEQRKIAQEVLRQVEEQAQANNRQGSVQPASSEQNAPEGDTLDWLDGARQSRQPATNDHSDWPDDRLPNSLLPKTKRTCGASGKAPAAANSFPVKHRTTHNE